MMMMMCAHDGVISHELESSLLLLLLLLLLLPGNSNHGT
jgi:hypothetical protein